MTRQRLRRNGRRGMAMASVLFAMAIFMLLGTLITTNALRTRNVVVTAESNFKSRNRLQQVAEYFVAEVKSFRNNGSAYPSPEDASAVCATMSQALTAHFAKYVYLYDVTATNDENVTTYILTIYTTMGEGEAALRTEYMHVAVRETTTTDGTTSYYLVEWKFV